MSNLLADFTNQYQLSKTLRFELKPVGKTAEWIEKHDIIGVKDDELFGKDVEKAKHYKYAKRLLDAMHRLFIEDALALFRNPEFSQPLESKFKVLQTQDELKIDDDLENIFKSVFDHTAIRWIEEYQQQMPDFWQEDLAELEQKLATANDTKKRKGFQSAVKAIQKKLKDPSKVIKKEDIKVMYSNEDAIHLLEWKIRTEKVKITFKELEQGDNNNFIPVQILCEYLREFNQFYTYFSGFNENRQNVYDLSGEKSTSIINRTINENLVFHFANLKKWQKVKKSLLDATNILAQKGFDAKASLAKIEADLQFNADAFFTVRTFCSSMCQSGIDRYNEIIGGQPALEGREKVQGINEFINLCRQQAGAKRQLFPPMQGLYKQILSKSDKTFIPEFSDDKDLFNEIEKFHRDFFVEKNEKGRNLFENFIQASSELANDLTEEYDNIFLPCDKVNRLSNLLTGSWKNLKDEILEIIGEKEYTKRKNFSFTEITKALEEGKKMEHFSIDAKYSGQSLIHFFVTRFQEMLDTANTAWEDLLKKDVLNQEKLDDDRSEPGKKGFEQIAAIKAFLDAAIALAGFVRDWQADKDILKKDEPNRIWYDHLDDFTAKLQIIGLYNMTRNYVTKKPGATEKLKITFENATLLNGWDRNKETDNYGILLEKDHQFYLAVMTAKSNRLFDYAESSDDTEKKAQEKCEKRQLILASSNENCFRKINYKLLPGANKMLPKVFFAAGNEKLFNPSAEIVKIKQDKLYTKEKIEIHGKKNLYDYIDFCIKSLCKHPDWSKTFHFTPDSFKKPSEYESIDQFYRDVELQGYSISFDKIKESYINKKIESGELYLFQIYNKDFSQNKKKKGTDNLHTIYWKGLFEPENIKDTVLKLNGQAEIFFRKASIKYTPDKLAEGHHAKELKGKFSYPIIKDKRFTENKFFFHCPITLNFGAPSIPKKFDIKIREFLKNNPKVNIIGIDRGEKHLLYYSIVDQNGKIMEQGSLNTISNGFIPNGTTESRPIDYHEKLDAVEKKRDIARKSWSMIENIKELKAGYLSQVVHKLAELIIKYNAIVVLEDLNMGFKRGRFGVEKQVYQKFEKALIDKLNYLVFKSEKDRSNAGHYLNAYQLTNKFESFQKMSQQTGILFYTTASYTSTTDPKTGFLKNIYNQYKSVEKSVEFWKSFDSIIYNQPKDRFEFTYTLGKVASKNMYREKDEKETQLKKRTWTVCSCVTRSRYKKAQESQTEEQKQNTSSEQIGKRGKHEIFFVTDKIKETLQNNGIDFTKNKDIQALLITKNARSDASFQYSMLYCFNAIMSMRVTDDDKEKGSKENDFILSPVEPFFDSRTAPSSFPKNGDANGAYNIARKGICILQKINAADDVSKVSPGISKQDWQNYAQSH